MTRYTRHELEIADHLWECLVRIAEDSGSEPQVVLNKALFDLARRFNFLTPTPDRDRPSPSQSQRPPASGASTKAMVTSGSNLTVVVGGVQHRVEKDPFIIGRSRSCDLVISSSKVSRQHCRVVKENSDYFIEDMGSPNGVWRDGVRVNKEKIKDGDEFMLSDESIKFILKSRR